MCGGRATPRVSSLLFLAGGDRLPAMGLVPRMDFDHSPLDDLSSPRAPVGEL